MTQPPQTAPSEDELAERLRGAIRQGDILNDGRMPPERALAEHFGVSRARLRLALGLLQEQHLVNILLLMETFMEWL